MILLPTKAIIHDSFDASISTHGRAIRVGDALSSVYHIVLPLCCRYGPWGVIDNWRRVRLVEFYWITEASMFCQVYIWIYHDIPSALQYQVYFWNSMQRSF